MSYIPPAAWLHTLHDEIGQAHAHASLTPENPWGLPGVDYSPGYRVTSEPLIALADLEARRSWSLRECAIAAGLGLVCGLVLAWLAQ